MRAFLWLIVSSHVVRELSRPATVVYVPGLPELQQDIADLQGALSELADHDLAQSCYLKSGRLYWFLKCSLVLDVSVISWVWIVWIQRRQRDQIIAAVTPPSPVISPPNLFSVMEEETSTSVKLQETLAELESLQGPSLSSSKATAISASKLSGGGPVRPSMLGKGSRPALNV